MRNLKIREVSEMVFRYMQEHQISLLEAYNIVSEVLAKQANPYSFEDIKNYLFHNEIKL